MNQQLAKRIRSGIRELFQIESFHGRAEYVQHKLRGTVSLEPKNPRALYQRTKRIIKNAKRFGSAKLPAHG